MEHIVGTATSTQQNGNPTIIDGTSTASLRIMKIASDGTYADSEIQSWSGSYHEEDQFSDNGTTEVATYSEVPAPQLSLKEIIPDNHGNLLASWSYGVPGWWQSCTTTGLNSQQQSTTCTGEVPGQDSQAHVGLLNGTTLLNDFTLSGVDYFTGPMVMGEGDTAFATGAKNADSLNLIVAFNAATGAALWSTTGTADLLQPIASTVDGGVVITDTPNSVQDGRQNVLRYDANGIQSIDAWSFDATGPLYANVQYRPAVFWLGLVPSSSEITALAAPGFDLAMTMWQKAGGNAGSSDRTAAPKTGLARLAEADLAGIPACATLMDNLAQIATISPAALISQIHSAAASEESYLYDGPTSNTPMNDPAKFGDYAIDSTVGEWFAPSGAEALSQENGWAIWLRLDDWSMALRGLTSQYISSGQVNSYGMGTLLHETLHKNMVGNRFSHADMTNALGIGGTCTDTTSTNTCSYLMGQKCFP